MTQQETNRQGWWWEKNYGILEELRLHSACCFEEESTAISSQECSIGSDPIMAVITQDDDVDDDGEGTMGDPYSRNFGGHFISEEDLFDLLQEVENELQRDCDFFVFLSSRSLGIECFSAY